MQSFILSLQSEFYKSRKTLAFWSAIILPLAITGLVFLGSYTNSHKMADNPAILLWFRYVSAIMGPMGILLLPMFVVFIAYSVNNLEHRSEMWKSLFSLPINKWSIYGSKFAFCLILNAFCLSLFATLILASGNLLGFLKPELKFHDYSVVKLVYDLHLKLFLSSLGILSLQFLMSLIWSDFLKPMGIGFVGTIAAIISVNVNWEYVRFFPYAHPLIAIQSGPGKVKVTQQIDFFTSEIIVSLSIAVVAFIAGYFIVSKRSVK